MFLFNFISITISIISLCLAIYSTYVVNKEKRRKPTINLIWCGEQPSSYGRWNGFVFCILISNPSSVNITLTDMFLVNTDSTLPSTYKLKYYPIPLENENQLKYKHSKKIVSDSLPINIPAYSSKIITVKFNKIYPNEQINNPKLKIKCIISGQEISISHLSNKSVKNSELEEIINSIKN